MMYNLEGSVLTSTKVAAFSLYILCRRQNRVLNKTTKLSLCCFFNYWFQNNCLIWCPWTGLGLRSVMSFFPFDHT
uniref:Uncharacterized protein n=1 Tax=Salix viminalis TaxID=40686 RepID=A0A6N2KVL9_SALVM